MLKSPESDPGGLWIGHSFLFSVVIKIKDRQPVVRVGRGDGKRDIVELLSNPDLPVPAKIP